MDFSALLASGETLTGAGTATVDKTTAPVLTLGAASVSGSIAQFRISGGVSNTEYKVTLVVTTSAGNTLEGEGIVQCKDL